MSAEHDDALEQELAGLDPETRAQVLEAHRLLEHDLSRLVDPLPPPGFLRGVMARVEAAPARAFSRTDQALAALIVVVTGAAGLGALAAQGSGGLGLAFTRLVLDARELVLAAGAALGAVWQVAALPLTVTLLTAMVVPLLMFRRLVLSRAPVSR